MIHMSIWFVMIWFVNFWFGFSIFFAHPYLSLYINKFTSNNKMSNKNEYFALNETILI